MGVCSKSPFKKGCVHVTFKADHPVCAFVRSDIISKDKMSSSNEDSCTLIINSQTHHSVSIYIYCTLCHLF
jgi:hypothetical protein